MDCVNKLPVLVVDRIFPTKAWSIIGKPFAIPLFFGHIHVYRLTSLEKRVALGCASGNGEVDAAKKTRKGSTKCLIAWVNNFYL